MARVLLIVALVLIAFWVYTIVDCAVQPSTAHRGVSKPVWILIVILLPVLGGILWFVVGRVARERRSDRGRAPDDDTEFLGRIGTMSDQDERIRRLEEELAQLDAEDDDPKWQTPDTSAPKTAATAHRNRRPRRSAGARGGTRCRRRRPRSARSRRLSMDPEADGERAVPETNEPRDDPRATPAPATDAAAALIAALVEHGVRAHRPQPGIALAGARARRRRARAHAEPCPLHVRIDERVAGFTALGIGREDGMPAAVVCTSGTAVANLLPAALEAHHAGVPLLLLTADRPPELRGVGANQTTRQPGMFAPNVRFEADVPVPEATDPDGDAEQSAMLRARRRRRRRRGARRGHPVAGSGAPQPAVPRAARRRSPRLAERRRGRAHRRG